MKNFVLTWSLFVFLSCFNCVDSVKDTFYSEPKPQYEKQYIDNEVHYLDHPESRVEYSVPDATKTADTSLMCHAIVACNQLVYAGHVQDERVCVENMREHFGNTTGNVRVDLAWYFKTYLDIQWSAPEVYTMAYGPDITVLEHMMDSIDDGNPVALSLNAIAGQDYGHVVMAFGYWMNEAGDEIDIYLVDGDDNVHTRIMTVTENATGDWPITMGYQKFGINVAVTLSPVN